jgi:hypothetical protein
MFRIFSFIAIGCLIASCATTKVKVNTIYTNGIPIDSLNLVSVMIGPVLQPVLPLLDAAAFNERTNKIADQILDEEQKSVNEFSSILIANLEQRYSKPVVIGNDLTSEAADKYRVKRGIQIDNKNFPIVFFSEGDLNMIDFGNGKNVNAIFKNNEALKPQIARFSSELNLKSVLISYNRLNVISAGMFGSSGTIRLETYLFLYNSRGDLIIDAFAFSKPEVINGKDIRDYKLHLNHFQGLSILLTNEFIKYIK